ncbi:MULTISPECIES: DUF1028 domain-containing protein [Halomicrobium]|uniref:DUF1028 domain-containing protein n=2 Tax=Halomicrobium mukohataei TaxID=57705 RepID=C7NZ65_HALMD|nr:MULTISPECIES: DUF1028 domain-containing protein [Halomicrobium]ACV46751.1 protein of unknown function DUF1028 [Halomicrobium mukohataei DSM 12286]QCD65260.1 DUF1028 domain-containing protein [Halomicrobium mukohataei]QFR20066.1 DUF1028 domain-containing protein [Halomicrobium sp. ZPS1]
MTFSICVREEYTDEEGDEQTRFGVAVTTRLAAVGTLCPFVSENGAVATQSRVNVDLGRRGIDYVDDGLAVEDALQSLLDADDGKAERQLHGVDADGEFAFSGGECGEWFGHEVGDDYTVAGNLLTGADVLTATATAYEEGRDGDAPLAERLIDALEAGHAAGGDKRTELEVQSAALLVATTEDRPADPYYDDLRVDATETPIEDLRETYELARESYEQALARAAERADDEDERSGEEPDGGES